MKALNFAIVESGDDGPTSDVQNGRVGGNAAQVEGAERRRKQPAEADSRTRNHTQARGPQRARE